MTLRIFLAGRVAVEVDGRLIEEDRFAGRQGRLVFACLVMAHGRPVPHEELAEAMWGESLPATWRKALTVIVSKVRALLAGCGLDGANVLTSAFGCYRLELPAGSWVDVLVAIESVDEAEQALGADELEVANDAARRAALLTRQPFLPGDEGAWVDSKRRELSDVRCRALACLADASLRAGRHSEAATWAEEAIALEPFRETGYRRLMDAHAAAGNRAEALRVYERCRVLLADELGAYPSPETESIYRRLLGGDPPDPAPEQAPERLPRGVDREAVGVNGSGPVAAGSRRRGLRVAAVFSAVAAAAALIALIAIGFTDDERPTLVRVQDNAVGVVDLQSGAIVDEAPAIASPQRVAAGEGAIWVTSSSGGGSVVRLDPRSHDVTDTIEVGNGPVGIAVGAGAVWVANSLDGTVSRVDPATGREVGDPIEVGNTPTGVAFGAGAVWVTNADDGTVSKIDPKSGHVETTIDVDAAAQWIAVGGGAVWVTDPVGNALVRIDAREGAVTDRTPVGSGPAALAFVNGDVWVTNGLGGTVARVDARRGVVPRLIDTIPVGVAPNAVTAAPDGVWLTDEVEGTLVHVDRASRQLAVTRLGGRPAGVALADGLLWIAVQGAGDAHRGGTLRVLADASIFDDPIDPVRNYTALQFLALVYDGLVGFKRVGGADGWSLVPDLATTLPTPTDNGRTYTFRLREGIRFADGRVLKASAVRSSFERLFRGEPYRPDYYEGIVGGRACTKRPARCDLSDGIATDDATGTVTIRLRAPDPEFLHKLALPFASVVPAGTPARGVTPLVGTGPYRITDYNPKRGMRLVRNRHFKVWWEAAQPQGVPDEIVIDVTGTPDAHVTAVQRGRADAVLDFPRDRFEEARTQYAAQLHVTPAPWTWYLVLNNGRPPFDDVRARQAVAYAVDRGRLAATSGAAPTCQLLPPGFPAYRAYCPYTLDPTEGVWTAPDLERARTLVAESGTKGMRVDVLGPSRSGLLTSMTNVLGKTLRQLGYRPSVRRLPFTPYFHAFHRGASDVEAAVVGWGADYPGAWHYLTGVATCTEAPDYACRPATQQKLRETLELQSRDPQAASEAWIQLDREFVDQAIVIPVLSGRAVDFVSERVGNYQRHPLFGMLLGQAWVR